MAQKKLSDTTIKYRQQQIKKDARLAVDYWHAKGLSENELLNVHKALAKRTNQRLVRLERAVSQITGENYASYGAGDIAKEYLKAKGVKGKLRFTENPKSTYLLPADKQTNKQMYDRVKILEDISTMQKFLTSPSSTVSGQKAIEKKRLETFKEKKTLDGEVIREGLNFASNKEFYDFLNSQTYKELKKTYNSDTIVEAYDQARGGEKKLTHEEIVDALEEYRKQENQDVKGLRASLGLKPIGE